MAGPRKSNARQRRLRFAVRVLLVLALGFYVVLSVQQFRAAPPSISIEIDDNDRLDLPAVVVCGIADGMHIVSAECSLPQDLTAEMGSGPAKCAAGVLPFTAGIDSETRNCFAANFQQPGVFIHRAMLWPMIIRAVVNTTLVPPGSLIGLEASLLTNTSGLFEVDDATGEITSAVVAAFDAAMTITVSREVFAMGKPTLLTLRKFEDVPIDTDDPIQSWQVTATTVDMDKVDLESLDPSGQTTSVILAMRYTDFRITRTVATRSASVASLLGEISGITGVLLGTSLFSLANFLIRTAFP
jgi:hypothetical protein